MRLHYLEVLPIFAHKEQIVRAIKENQVVVVVGETGSGKSTQIPKMIVEALADLWQTDPSITPMRIACTQPRRIATVTIAGWIADEMQVELGKEVGYKIRFDDDTSEGTVINICTDGILLQEMKGDQLLSRYDAVMVDEAHERNLNIDFLLGLLKDIQEKRLAQGLKELKIIVTSATFDAEKFARFFDEQGNIPVINVSGRMYPVDIIYRDLADQPDIGRRDFDEFQQIAKLVEEIVAGKWKPTLEIKEGDEGEKKEAEEGKDILVFMPGEGEIFKTIREIELRLGRKVVCVPLYSRLSMEDQQLIYSDFKGQVKVVVATNIAETSLTVPGIKYVIDAGTARLTDFDFRTGIGSLEVRSISQASAVQRAGRAGRIESGVCFRLYSEEDFARRPKYTKPEIQRSDLSSVVLHMLLLGIKDLYGFKFIDPPEGKAYKNAINNLIELGAIDDQLNLSSLGVKMAHLPLEPRISAMLLAAEKHNCVREVAIIASSLSVKDPFLRPNGEEIEADRAKRFFQRIATGAKVTYKKISVRRGRRVFIKKIPLKSHDNGHLASDLIVFLIVWNKLQSIQEDHEREAYCAANYLNYLVIMEIEQIYRQLLDTLNIFAKDEFSKYLLEDGETDLSVLLDNREGIIKSIASGFLQNLCEFVHGQMYRTRTTENVFIHPGSALFNLKPQFFVSAEIVETTKLYARNNTVIQSQWLKEVAPHLFKKKQGEAFLDSKNGRVIVEEAIYFRGQRVGGLHEANVSDYNADLAQKVLVSEGLIKGQLRKKYYWLAANRDLAAKQEFYLEKLLNKKSGLLKNRLEAWYIDKLASSGKKIVSVSDLDALIREKGENYLKLSESDLLDRAELQMIAENFPKKVFLAGKSYQVEYFFNHFRFPDGPLIELLAADLMNLSGEIVSANLIKYPDLKPYFVVKTAKGFASSGDGGRKQKGGRSGGGAESGGHKGKIIVEGYNIDDLKEDLEVWHYRLERKVLRRDKEVRGVSLDKIWQFVPRVLEKYELGPSIYSTTQGKTRYLWSGLRMERHKFSLLLFVSEELAFNSTMDFLEKYYQARMRREAGGEDAIEPLKLKEKITSYGQIKDVEYVKGLFK